MKKLSELLNASQPVTSPLFHGALIAVDNDFTSENGYPISDFIGTDQFEALGLDVFGDIFLLIDERVARLNTETGEVDETWPNVEQWVEALNADPDTMVGQGFLLDWESQNGKLEPNHRLTSKMPFVFGGNYEISNIVSIPIPELLSFRADIARQIRDLPDGSRIMVDTI